MGRRKRDREQQKTQKQTDSRDSDNEISEKRCPHVGNAVKLTNVKKLNKRNNKIGNCVDCQRESIRQTAASTDIADDVDINAVAASNNQDVELCVCLKCSHLGCSRSSDDQHALKHAANSKAHCIAVNLTTWQVWCYECDDDVSPNATNELHACIIHLRKTSAVSEKGSTSRTRRRHELEDGLTASSAIEMPIRGLGNLGNTCFFNAVMQNLLQTPLLLMCLSQDALQATCVLSPSEQPPLTVQRCKEPGSLTVALQQFFINMSSGSRGVVSPKQLFAEVCRKAARFRGYQQQDSQELLRYLLDVMKMEEIRRIKLGILECFGAKEHKKVDGMEEETKQKIRTYGRCATQTFVDSVFGGELASTVVCQQCNNVSVMYEPFLDLSLPLRHESTHAAVWRKKGGKWNGDEFDAGLYQGSNKQTNAVSKHKHKQMAKEKRKNAKRKNFQKMKMIGASQSDQGAAESGSSVDQQSSVVSVTNTSRDVENMEQLQAGDSDVKQSSTELQDVKEVTKQVDSVKVESAGGQEDTDTGDQTTDYDVVKPSEDNMNTGECQCKVVDSKTAELCDQTASNVADGKVKCMLPKQMASSESEICSRFEELQIQESNEQQQNDDETLQQEYAVTKTVTGDIANTLLNSYSSACADDNGTLSGKEMTENGFAKQRNLEIQAMTSTCLGTNATNELEGSANADKVADSRHIERKDDNAHNTNLQSAAGLQKSQLVETVVSDSKDEVSYSKQLTGTLASRYIPKHGELSVQACLARFSSTELLDGTNKFSCNQCTMLALKKQQTDTDSEDNISKFVALESDDANHNIIDEDIKSLTNDTDGGQSCEDCHSGMSENQGSNSELETPADSPLKTKVTVPAVYTVATKQLLLHRLPPVLTLHLKRFQQARYGLQKITEAVSFPFILDLAPFCTGNCKTPANEEGRILYSLYGIVEHAGTLRSGHYTAYIKLRSSPSQLNHKQDIPQLDGVVAESKVMATATEGRWYHISDSSVSCVSEERVRSSQAYVLFYEKLSPHVSNEVIDLL